ncbi:hypothetical protein DFH07DRAFT_1019650 [Mycena maculata]|uniref:Uncharacterized protein n=1 Tax=Mycena maculata TaxID=230809 RepID=A0AAD7NIP3_9AGAR|nr:hypothetical protein DFH07DRAFT_1019650 [Mycena maculata]
MPDKARPRAALALLAALAPDKGHALAPPLPPPLPLAFDIAITPAPTPTTTARYVPPQYSSGPDGVWRRLDSYALVGSTICDSCTSTPTSTIDPSSDEFTSSLPSGWNHTPVATPERIRLTIGLSLALAVVIVATIVRCSLYRRAKTPQALARKAEKAARRAEQGFGEKREDEKAPKTPLRKWLRATARWRDNARYLARQRRGRRAHPHTPYPASTGASPAASRESLVTAALTRTSTRASDVPSLSSASSTSLEILPPLHLEPPAYPASPPLSPTRARPRGKRRDLDLDLDNDELELGPGSALEEAHPPYTPAYAYVAAPVRHVATDDKALLESLAARASAPPAFAAASSSGGAYVPDEDELPLPELEPHPAYEPAAASSSSASMPAPPAGRIPPPPAPSGAGWEKMEAERAYAVRDAQPQLFAPSAPSYAPQPPEAGPSTPRLLTAPSAPPLFEDEDAEEGGGLASAPPMFDEDADENGESDNWEREWETDGDAEGARRASAETREGAWRTGTSERERHAPVGAGEAHDTGWVAA